MDWPTSRPRRTMAGPTASSGDMWRPYPEFRLNDKDLTIEFIIFNNVMYDQKPMTLSSQQMVLIKRPEAISS